MDETRLILASASQARRQLLTSAGLEFEVITSDLDEDAVKQAFLSSPGDQDLADLAMILAQAKAMTVSENHSEALVVAADQILVADGNLGNKPESREDARDQLLALRGKSHSLESAVCVAKNGEILWSHQDRAVLTVRDFTPEFLGQYLSDAGQAVTQSVGGYQLEGPGIQLFEKVEGSYFTILGLPLLPLLSFLRDQEIIAT